MLSSSKLNKTLLSLQITIEKSQLREAFKTKRAELSQIEAQEKSQKINQNFLENLLPKIYKKNSQKKFSLYLASNNEVATNVIAEHFIKNEIIFSYPKIVAQNEPLKFLQHQQNQAFAPNKIYKNIFEPIDGEEIFPDFLIVPLLAFDHNLTRIGMGGGFFDRTISALKAKNSQIITIGLAYKLQLCDEPLPKEKTDQSLDFIVSETDVFS